MSARTQQPRHGFTYYHGYDSPFEEFPAFTHVNEAICTADHILSPHAHPHYEFCYFFAGHAEWTTGGERYRLNPGDFYISRPGELHSGLPDPQAPNHNFAVGFDPAQLALAITENGTLTSTGSRSEVSAALVETCAVTPINLPHFQRVIPGGQGAEVTYRRILTELDQLDPADPTRRTLTRLMVQVLLVDLLVSVTRLSISLLESRQVTSPLARPPRVNISALLSWLPSQLACPPSLSTMAERVGLSPTHFAVAFKREVGCTPLEFVTQLRIAEAARRLRSGSRVTDCALDLGFSSSQYFSLVFKKQIGCTPSEWRGSA
jgi:AraC-like DNA-binding protein